MPTDGVQAIFDLAESHSLRLRSREAVQALITLAREARQAKDRQLAETCVAVGRRLATPEAVELLLDRVGEDSADVTEIAATVRFRGPELIEQVLRRLNGAEEIPIRRAYFNLACAVGAFPELRRPLIGQLHVALGDDRWYVVRNTIMLLNGIGASLPLEHLWDLARARHRQVRLALTHVLARWKPNPDGLDLLTALLEDEDPGVRFAAATGLGPYAHPRARQALARRAARETDLETKAACEAALSRRVVALRSA